MYHVISLPGQKSVKKNTVHIKLINLLTDGLVYVCLFVCLFGVFRPTRELFTHLETSSLPVKDCKF